MQPNQFSSEQIASILQKAEKGERTAGALCKEHDIVETMFDRRRPRFGDGAHVKEVQRLTVYAASLTHRRKRFVGFPV